MRQRKKAAEKKISSIETDCKDESSVESDDFVSILQGDTGHRSYKKTETGSCMPP